MSEKTERELFKLVAPYKPTGDQPEAIAKLVEGIKRGDKEQTLLGVTGSGKTDRKSTRLNSSHSGQSRMPSSA